MVARLIELCARNRLLVLLGVALAMTGALWSIRQVKLEAIPDLSDTQVVVTAPWMGRSPTLVEAQVTYPVVSALVGAPRVADVRGYSMFGMSFVYVIFEEGTDIYWARSRVVEYLSAIGERLPEGVTPVVGPDASGNGWALQYVLVDRSGTAGLDDLRAFQDFTLRQALGSVPGVAEVASVGGYQKQYQVVVDPERLRAYGLTLGEVIRAVREATGDVGGRILEAAGREYYVRGLATLTDLPALERTAVRAGGPGVAPVRVGDLGTVRFGPDLRRGLLEWNGEGEAVGGIVVLRSGQNTLEVVDAVKRRLAELKPGFPKGLEVEVAYDRTDLIHRAIATLRRALLEEAITVAAVVLLFLLHARSALLPVLSLPVAVGLTFIPMWLLDIPATIMSLGGIAIALGATVDAEIVMIEASHKKLEHARPGADRRALLAEAAREVTPAIFFSLLVVAVAFLPVLALNGQAGRLFKPLAWTKTFVMLAAALVSVTLAPALRDLLLRGPITPESRHPVSRAIIRAYKPFVFVALRNPRSTILIGLLAVLSAIPLALRLGQEFMPPLEEGDVLYMPTTLPGISVEEAKRVLQIQDRVLRGFPEVASVFGKAGRAETATDPAPLSMVETTVRLRPVEAWRQVPQRRWWSGWAPGWLGAALRPLWPDARRISFDELTAEMNSRLQLAGWTNAFTMPIKARIDMLSTGVRTPVGLKVLGPDLERIEQVGTALERILAPVPGTRSVLYERNTGGLYVDVVPDREALARHGVSAGEVQRTIEAAIGGATIGQVLEGRRRFSISVRYPQDLRGDVEALRRVLVPVGRGGSGGSMRDQEGALRPHEAPRVLLAQMPGEVMGGAPAPGPRPSPERLSDAPSIDWSPRARAGKATPGFVPLGQLADIRVVDGPPMVRDDGGQLVGYVYVDVEPSRDLAGYVGDARAAVDGALARGELKLPAGTFLRWTGQYQLMEETAGRMRVVVPLTLLIIALLLWIQFRSFTEVLIVLLSIPFALVGSVWLLWLLDYRVSTAVWVGVVALVGLAAQTGVLMIVYIDQAYERRKRAGRIRDLDDIIWAHLEGTVLRVRPKLMTVSTMLLGLLPLLWATGSGADVMKRIAAPMVGGLLTSAFLTLEIIPVVYTGWRLEQLLWERLAGLDPARLARLQVLARVQQAGWAAMAALLVSTFYLAWPGWALGLALAVAVAVVAWATVRYAIERPAAKRLVWPSKAPLGEAA